MLNLSLFFSFILISSNDFMTVLISIEGLTMSLSILIATNLTPQGIEASIKYIFVSILGSGFICLSLCLLYSQIGSLNFNDIF
jgi:NADH:ubiquinone oxidoreductase subunit 2 (subunit N)